MTIQYTLVRSARKSIAISFNEQGELVVKAPLHIETSQIEALLREKAALIERHRRIWQAQKAAQPPEPTLQEQRALSSQARLRLAPLVEKYAAVMGVRPARVKITSAKTRWGSCSSKGVICFSWRLMQKPDAFIEYVVVHELAHLRELNHSARFWAIVGSVLPDYQQRRRL